MPRGLEIRALLETSVVTSPAPRKRADDAVAAGVAEAEALAKGVADAEPDGERVAEADTDGVRVAEADTEGETEAVEATLGDGATEPLALGERETLAEAVGDGETVGVAETEKTWRSATNFTQSQPPPAPTYNSIVPPAGRLVTVPVKVSGFEASQPTLVAPAAGAGKA